jgi:hypothetical protein
MSDDAWLAVLWAILAALLMWWIASWLGPVGAAAIAACWALATFWPDRQ